MHCELCINPIFAYLKTENANYYEKKILACRGNYYGNR